MVSSLFSSPPPPLPAPTLSYPLQGLKGHQSLKVFAFLDSKERFCINFLLSLSRNKCVKAHLNLRVSQKYRSRMILHKRFQGISYWQWALELLINFLNHHHRYFCLSEVWSTKWQLQVGDDFLLVACSNSHVYLLIWHSFDDSWYIYWWLIWYKCPHPPELSSRPSSLGKACSI